jgi:hypothetical protein
MRNEPVERVPKPAHALPGVAFTSDLHFLAKSCKMNSCCQHRQASKIAGLYYFLFIYKFTLIHICHVTTLGSQDT